MMRLKIHLHNEDRNSAFKSMLERTFSAHSGVKIEVQLNGLGKMQKIKGSHTGYKPKAVCDPGVSDATPTIPENAHRGSGEQQIPETCLFETGSQQHPKPDTSERINVSSTYH